MSKEPDVGGISAVGDLRDLGLVDAAVGIRNGYFTAETYAAQLLERHSALTPLNAILTIDESRLLDQACAVDRARARGERLGPLAGVPFVVKDQIDVVGYPTTAGNPALQTYMPRQTAPVVAQLVAAGGIVFAKANMPDLIAYDGDLIQVATSANPNYGDVRNPYDPTCVPGGSSGGNAAAIAARIVPAGIGEDTGGSIRFPAACCGIAGLRPSTFTIRNALSGGHAKRYSDEGLVPTAGLLETLGPMARTVADCAMLDWLVTGDPVSAIDLVETRIAVPRADYWDQAFIDAGVVQVMQGAFDKIREAGAVLVEVDFNALLAAAGAGLLSAFGGGDSVENTRAWLEKMFPSVTVDALYAGRNRPPPSSMIGADERIRILTVAARSFEAFFASHDVIAIAFPTTPITARPRERDGALDRGTVVVNGKSMDEVEVITKNVYWGPLLGAPGLSFPAGMAGGLPVGMELQGLPGDDSRILGLGIAIENALGRIPAPAFGA